MHSMKHIAETANFKNKMDLFSSVRNALVNNRLTVDEHKGVDPTRWAGMSYGLFFPDKNDQSFLETYEAAVDDPTLFASLWKNTLDKPSKYHYWE